VEVSERLLIPAFWLLLVAVLAGTVVPTRAESKDAQLRAAQLKMQAREFASAEEILRALLAEDPRSSVAHNLLGICQERTGQHEAARESFQKAIEYDPHFASAHTNLGYLLLAEKKESAAIQEFKKAIAADPAVFTRDPTSFMGFDIYGLCLMDDRKYAEAQRAFERSVQINPRFIPARVNLGSVLAAVKQDDAALKEFLAVSSMAPNQPFILKNIGLIYEREEKFELAARYLGQAHGTMPEDDSTSTALAVADIKIGHDAEAKTLITELALADRLPPEAREQLALLWLESDQPQNAADLVRGHPDLSTRCYKAGYRMADDELEKGNYPVAGALLEAIRGLETPDAAFHDKLGTVYYVLDDPQKAAAELQLAVQLEPENPDHYFRLGMIFLKHRTTDPAILLFESALKKLPNAPNLWVGLGMSYYFANRFHDAEATLRKALELDPNYALAYVTLGDFFEQTGRVDEALDIFRKVMRMRPDLFWPYYYYGKLASKPGHGNNAEAVEMLRKAVQLNPSYPEAHCELGRVLARTGETQEAIAELNKSIQLNPDLAQSYYQLALVYRKTGDQAKAQEQFRKFETLSKKPNPESLIRHLDVQIGKPQ